MYAFLVYTIWWHKPLAPKEPILLKGGSVKALPPAPVSHALELHGS